MTSARAEPGADLATGEEAARAVARVDEQSAGRVARHEVGAVVEVDVAGADVFPLAYTRIKLF